MTLWKRRWEKGLLEQEGLKDKLAEVLLCEGITYTKLNNFEKARSTLDASINLAKRLNLLEVESSGLINQGKVYLQLDNIEKANTSANEGFQIAKKNNYVKTLSDGYLTLSQINKKYENYKLSSDYLTSYINLSDSLRVIKRKYLSPEKKIEVLMSDQIEKNRKTVEDLNEANSKNDLSTLISILSVALITILSLLTLSLYKNNNIRLKTNNMLHKKNSELIIANQSKFLIHGNSRITNPIVCSYRP